MSIRDIQVSSTNLRKINKGKILEYIQYNQGVSRADISKALLISKPTVSSIVDELLSEGWIREKESANASSLGGRKPYEIYFNQDAYYLIGVDIGGTSVEMAVMNLTGEIQDKKSIATQSFVGSQLIPVIANTIKELIQDNNLEESQVFGVGIGVPGITDVENGIVIDAPSVNWQNVNLKSQLEVLLPFPIYLDNDVNIAALGELWKGIGKKTKNYLMITLGTGIGCGLIINGELYRGSSYAAGEIGYMVTDKNAAEKGYDHTFIGYGFLDNHVGGPAITRKMQRHLNEMDECEPWSAKRIFDMAKSGDKAALQVIDDTVSHLSFALINVISIFNPEKIVLGGKISKSMNPSIPNMMETIEKHIPIKAEVETTKVKDASLLGAGYLLLKEHESILQN